MVQRCKKRNNIKHNKKTQLVCILISGTKRTFLQCKDQIHDSTPLAATCKNINWVKYKHGKNFTNQYTLNKMNKFLKNTFTISILILKNSSNPFIYLFLLLNLPMVPYQTYQNVLLIFMWWKCLSTDWKYINIMETKKKTIQPQM